MFVMDSVPIKDWLFLAVGLIGLIIAHLESRDRLPSWARNWLSRIGRDKVERAIDYAAGLQGLSDEDRRKEAVGYLVRLSERQLGLRVPESVANLLVEYVYQYVKRRP